MKTKLLLSIFAAMFIVTAAHSQSHVWGLTLNGGGASQGAIIVSNSDGTGLNVAHSFQGPAGFHPYGNLLLASDGNLYGTCYDGGTYGSCTIFKYEPSTGIYTDVYSFDIVHGDYPKSGVVEGPNGKLYGAATAGGAGGGVIYCYDMNTGTYSALYNFASLTGSVPYGNPILHSDGKLYGMTTSGGLYSSGVIYSYDIASGLYTDEYDFDGATGSNPKGSLIEITDGTVFGVTSSGGANGAGVLFSFTPSEDVFTKLVDFSAADGSIPQGTLMQASDGLLYGLTSGGGVNGSGVLFSYNMSSHVYTNHYNFNMADGSMPLGSLLQFGNKLCGTTSAGGTSGVGVMFNFELSNGAYTKVLDFNNSNGANPTGGLIAVMSTTGIALNQLSSDHASVFPNPAVDEIKVTLSSGQQRQTTLCLRDATGRLVSSSVENIGGSKVATVSLKDVPAGTYFLEITAGAEKLVKQVIKN
jgi:uncharacterized repeat protein (TIGR03803 family)